MVVRWSCLLPCILALIGCSRITGSPALATGASIQSDSQTYNFETLYRFTNPAGGAIPVGALLGLNGALFGTTYQGGDGKPGSGVVFEITSSEEKVVHAFTNSKQDGKGPYAGLTDVDGTFYGTTQEGGEYGLGTVFSVTASGTEKVVFSFNGQDGSYPRAAVIDVNGLLYGTTYYGGAYAYGTVFSITTGGSETVLHSFKGGKDGALPLDNLIALQNTFYGTTSLGGVSNDGTIFKIGASGKENVLHDFKGDPDGAQPFAALTDVNGVLYGTTYEGGTHNLGTVFEVAGGKEKVLYSFAGGDDGASPYAGLTLLNGTLYGDTSRGGGSDNYGTLYTVTPSGAEKVIFRFNGGESGRVPYASLTAVNGALYGTTLFKGGTIYELSP